MKISSPRFLQACFVSLILGMTAGFWVVPQAIRADAPVLFFASTGHHLSDEYGFLSYWRSGNGPFTLGAPLTEAFADGDLMVQYFTFGRLERHPEYNNAIVRGRLGVEYSAALFRQFAAATLLADQPDRRFFAETRHTLAVPFRSFWEAYGGLEVFGFPISEPIWEYVGSELLQVQYFERVRLEYRTVASDPALAVQISPLGRDITRLRGIATSPVASQVIGLVGDDGLPLVLPEIVPTSLPNPTAPPTALKPTAKPSVKPVLAAAPLPRNGKSIIVDIGDQWLYAYEGETLVYDAPISTGRDGFNTPIGSFAVYAKLRSQTMEGTLGGEYYRVPNVPHVMYIVGGVAIHGTYWHNRFGSGVRMSHGCINVGLNQAAWLYTWTPMGTPVTVRW